MKPLTPQQVLDEVFLIRMALGHINQQDIIHDKCTDIIKRGIIGDNSNPLTERINVNSSDDPMVSNAVGMIRIIQSHFTNEQRLALWSEIKKGFCYHCGSKCQQMIDGCMVCNQCNRETRKLKQVFQTPDTSEDRSKVDMGSTIETNPSAKPDPFSDTGKPSLRDCL